MIAAVNATTFAPTPQHLDCMELGMPRYVVESYSSSLAFVSLYLSIVTAPSMPGATVCATFCVAPRNYA